MDRKCHVCAIDILGGRERKRGISVGASFPCRFIRSLGDAFLIIDLLLLLLASSTEPILYSSFLFFFYSLYMSAARVGAHILRHLYPKDVSRALLYSSSYVIHRSCVVYLSICPARIHRE